MSTEILDAIDAEIDRLGSEIAVRRQRTEALSMTRELVEGLENGKLEQLHSGLTSLVGGGEAVKPPPVKKAASKPKGRRKKVAAAAPPKAPSEGERQERNASIMERHQRILALARERGEITAVDVIEAGIASKNSARSSLQRMSIT